MLVRRNQQKRCTEMGKPAQLQFARGLCLNYKKKVVQLYSRTVQLYNILILRQSPDRK